MEGWGQNQVRGKKKRQGKGGTKGASSKNEKPTNAGRPKQRCTRGKACTEADAKKVVGEYRKRRKVERLACSTGNAMIDQFEPWYFGVAFAFLFKYCTGMPDMPAFAKKPRLRVVDLCFAGKHVQQNQKGDAKGYSEK